MSEEPEEASLEVKPNHLLVAEEAINGLKSGKKLDLDFGFDFETAEEYLLYHSRAGNTEVVEKLIQLKEAAEIELDVNCKGKHKSNYGWTPLQLASYFGHFTVAQLLIQHKANVNAINETGDTALHKAAYTGREELVVLLLANNADVFIANDEELTAKDLAQKESIRDLLIAAELADKRRREDQFLRASKYGDIKVLKSLLSDPGSSWILDQSNSIDINCQDESGNSALHCAAVRGQKEVAVFLLKHGIDSSLKNKKGQLAATVAPSIHMKQLLQDVKPVSLRESDLPKCSVQRVEGPLLRKGRFLGWRAVWGVLERGVLSFFASRADSTTGTRRKGYRYLESSVVEASEKDPSIFIIYFWDKSKVMLALPQNSSSSVSQIDRQKWINAVKDHVEYSTNFIRQGLGVDDDDDDDLRDLMPLTSMQPMIATAQAHNSILEKHIKGLLQFVSEDMHSVEGNSLSFSSYGNSDDKHVGNSKFYGSGDFNNFWPALKFHSELILESAGNTSASLTQCLAVLSQQEQLRQLQQKHEKEKCRVLEEALRVLANEHHDLENSVVCSVPYHSPPRPQSGCVSDTDADEFYDAFDDEDEREGEEEAEAVEKTAPDGNGAESAVNMESSLRQTLTDSSSHEAPGESINDLCDREHYSNRGRTRLPAPMVSKNDISLWSILKHCIGKELSKVTMPVVFNEPLSFLQRVTENVEYAQLLAVADQCEDPVERMEHVCAFAVAALSSNWERMTKPFNPLLGETYELTRPDLGFRIMCEQVSHHPPVSAYYADNEHFQLNGSVHPKLKFWGKSIEVKPEGTVTLKLLNHNEVYTWKNVNCCVHNIIVGKLWFEQYGLMEIVNHANGLKASLNFKAAGWFGKDLHRLEGFIFDKDKNTKLRFLYGKWTDYLKSASVEDFEDYMKNNAHRFRVPDKPQDSGSNANSPANTPKRMMSKLNSITKQLKGSSVDVADNDGDGNGPQETGSNGDIPKSDSSHSLDIPNSRLLWVAEPRPLHSAEYYNFTLFTMTLNEMTEGLKNNLPLTDSRLRPDVRLLEEGDLDGAADEKNRLEEKQRETRKLRKKRKDSWSPLWFRLEHNAYTKEDDWRFLGNYWEKNYSHSPDIF